LLHEITVMELPTRHSIDTTSARPAEAATARTSVIGTTTGLLVPVCAIEIDADLVPTPTGLKTTEIEHEVRGANDPQLLVNENCAGSEPVNVTPVMLSTAVPVLVTVSVRGSLDVLTV
jgi:hypothetical protein